MANARRSRFLVLALPMILLAVGATPVWAGDEKEGESAAERAFIAAWWAETSSGALDRAVEGYRTAVAAKGPDAVRAKALYRLAVVLERVGKTGEAIRTLERLASDFPDETELQAKARERLEEWTAVDLRTNFDEWYRRYQYSQEFQARIVELVLKLGGDPMSGEKHAAYRELLTIGAASIPALEAHLDSTSDDLRQNAVRILMLLGKIPPARHLIETDLWKIEEAAWDLLLAADADTRADLLSQLSGDTDIEKAIRALLAGPDRWTEALRHEMSLHLFQAMLDRDDVEQPVYDFLELVNALEGEQRQFCDGLARQLMEHGHAPDETLVEWLALPEVRHRVALRIAEGELRSPRALEAVVDALLSTPPLGVNTSNTADRTMYQALLQAIADAPDETDLAPAARAFEHAWRGRLNRVGQSHPGTRRKEPTDVRRRLYEEVMSTTRDPAFAMDVLRAWCNSQQEDPQASRRLLEWAGTLKGGGLPEYAARMAGTLASEETLDEVLAAHATLPQGPAHELIAGLRRNRNLVAFDWSHDRLWVLIDLVGNLPHRAQKGLMDVFKILLASRDIADEVIGLMAEQPLRTAKPEIPAMLIRHGHSWSESRVRHLVKERWQEWRGEERLLVLDHLVALWGTLGEHDTAFLRTCLRDLDEESSDGQDAAALKRELKRSLLMKLPTVTVDDVRAAFDLSTPAGALAAFATKRLPHTAETYDLLAAAREVEDAEKRWKFLNAWIQHAEDELECRAARAMATDADEFTRQVGLKRLMQSRNAVDVRVFARALEDVSSDVRYVAAEALAGAYDKEAILSLVKVLYDPDADVRDRVLQTLEAIKETESKKEYWREFAENAR